MLKNGRSNGCWDNIVVGAKRVDKFCPSCKYRKSVAPRAQHQPSQSFEEEDEQKKAKEQKKTLQKQNHITHLGRGRATALTRKGIGEKSLTRKEEEKIESENAIVHLPIG